VAHVHTGVAGGVQGVTDDGDLVAVLGVVHVEVHYYHQHQHNDPAAVDTENLRQPSGLIEHGDDLRAGTTLPRAALQPADHADDDVVHHQGEQSLVGVPAGLEEGGDQRPNAAGHGARSAHDEQQHGAGDLTDPVEGEVGGGDGAGRDLTLGADVPEAHLEAWSDGQGAAQQGDGDLHRLADGGLFAQSAGDDGAVGFEGVHTGDGDDQCAQQQRQQDGAHTDGPHRPLVHALSLGQTDQGRFHRVIHERLSPFRRHGSSAGLPLPWWWCDRLRCR